MPPRPPPPIMVADTLSLELCANEDLCSLAVDVVGIGDCVGILELLAIQFPNE